MFINYKHEIYALAHLNLSTASFKCTIRYGNIPTGIL